MSKVICIDAGHGGKDSGAVGNSVIEKTIALKTALIIGEMLKEQGFDVVFTRTSDVYVQLNERCRIANSKNAERIPVLPMLPISSLSTKTQTAVFLHDLISKIALNAVYAQTLSSCP